MTEMIERVAKAMQADDGSPCISRLKFDLCRSGDGCICRSLARAAIEAMREPTLDMIEEGAFVSHDGDDIVGRSRAKVCYRAMIDQALAELGPQRDAGTADEHGVPRAEE